MSKGMEIFNTDDFSEDFLELDENMTVEDTSGISGIVEPVKVQKSVKPTKTDQKQDVDEDDDEELEIKENSDELEVLLPSGKSNNTDQDISSNSSKLSPKFFSSLVQALKEGGILEDIKDEDIKSQEDFFKVLEDGIKQREFSDLTDDQKEYLEAVRSGIPHEEVVAHQRNIDAYNNITEEVIEEESTDGEELRRTIIMNNYISKGFTEQKAKKLADKIFESGEDVDEAKDALTELKTIEKKTFDQQKVANIEAKKAQDKSEKEAIDKLNKIAKDTKELIPGLTIPQALKNNIIKGLTQPAGYTEDKRPLDIISKYLYENPIEGRFKLAYLLSVTEGLSKMGVLENKRAKKSAFDDLANAIKFRDEGGAISDDGNDDGGFDFSKFEF